MLEHVILGYFHTIVHYCYQAYTEVTVTIINDQKDHNNNRNVSKQAVNNEFIACLGVRMHDWHTVGGAFPLHLIPLIISVSVEQMSMPSKTLSSTSILSVKHHAAHYHYTTLQLTDFTSAIECATVETLASNSSRVV